MKLFTSKKGVALITTLILSLICLALVAAVMQIVVTSIKTSGTIKRYTSALEAAKGGIEDFTSSLLNTDFNVTPTDSRWVPGHNCKVDREINNWPTVCAAICANLSDCTSHSTPDDIVNHADWVANYGGYTVYCKIVDVKATENGYLYGIEVLSQKNNSYEKAWFTILYKKE